MIQVYLIPRPGQDVYTRAETPFRLKPRTDIRFRNNAAKKLQVTRQRFKDNLNLRGGAPFALVWWKEFSPFPIVTSPAGSQSLCNVYSHVKTIRGSDAVLPGVLHPPSNLSEPGARSCVDRTTPPARESDRQTHFSLSPPLPPVPTFASRTPPHNLRRPHSTSTESPVPCTARVIP